MYNSTNPKMEKWLIYRYIDNETGRTRYGYDLYVNYNYASFDKEVYRDLTAEKTYDCSEQEIKDHVNSLNAVGNGLRKRRNFSQ